MQRVGTAEGNVSHIPDLLKDRRFWAVAGLIALGGITLYYTGQAYVLDPNRPGFPDHTATPNVTPLAFVNSNGMLEPVPTATKTPLPTFVSIIHNSEVSATAKLAPTSTPVPERLLTPKELVLKNAEPSIFKQPVPQNGQFVDYRGRNLGLMYENLNPENPSQLFYTKGVEVFKSGDYYYSRSYMGPGDIIITRIKDIRYFNGQISPLIKPDDLGKLKLVDPNSDVGIFLPNSKYPGKEANWALGRAINNGEILDGNLDFDWGIILP